MAEKTNGAERIENLIILGGGYIGIEFAQLFARFGSRVTVVEMLDEIIKGASQNVAGTKGAIGYISGSADAGAAKKISVR